MSLNSNNPLIRKLRQQAQQQKQLHLAELFSQDPQRFEYYHLTLNDLLFDYSKQCLSTDVLANLLALAKQANLAQWIDKFFAGAAINNTEQRAAMHWALRAPTANSVAPMEPTEQLSALVAAQLEKMAGLVELLQQGHFRGVTGEAITDVVNLGVGGSELGPLMASRALDENMQQSQHKIKVHFASSMDGSQMAYLLKHLRAETTLFIISSKSFTTVDTLSNAQTAYDWLLRMLGELPQIKACHFIAVSADIKRMTQWGVVAKNQLQMCPWVGGRFSLWSCIGLPIALTIGMSGFKDLLAGAHAMDVHFRHADWQQNLPVLMALIGIWNVNFLQINTQAVLPYDGRLKYLADYLQQLEMESNGISVNRDDEFIDYASCPIVWGNIGSNSQHAFYQLLHQGTQAITCDFIVTAQRYLSTTEVDLEVAGELYRQHQLSLANCLAQSRLLALGDAATAVDAIKPNHQKYGGNQPSSTMVLRELTPFNLGMLLAAYEHKVFVQSVIWNINPFDQWGVEKGKAIANDLLPAIVNGAQQQELDSSSQGLVDFIRGQD